MAPFEVALQRLNDARLMVSGGNFDDALNLVRRASCNCYTFEALSTDSLETRASLITQNLKLADPCTFRILVKATTLFLDADDPLKVSAYEALEAVIRSFSKLDDALLLAGEWNSETKDEVAPLLDATMKQVENLKDMVAQSLAREI